ncbi:protein Wnt-6 [Centruroides vittatus]|uniref:protein Wnt-6-like n=1 Tax=Centruroides sculpturatus TaxID=218467 RepID=UPI000C6D43D8|nr:protein Wnt-6-like [Centruroides sculpturatus]
MNISWRYVLIAVFLLDIWNVSCLWWTLGRQLVLDPSRICKKTRRLRGKQMAICQQEPVVIRHIGRGAQLGVRECQYQFRSRRWNCSRIHRSMRKVLVRDTRETGYVNAITAAGVTHALTQACSQGLLLDCSCGQSMRSVDREGQWEWNGCGDNVEYGYRKSAEFMNDRYRKRSDIKTMVLNHNYEAGRLAVKNYMRIMCKCHGMSGSCTVKSCWHKLPIFRDVGHRLKEKFDGAAKVTAGNDGKGFIPEGETIKPPDKEDLVYSEDSPSYCVPNRKTGSLGTKGRECNDTSMGVEGCDLLCCGRGYDPTKVTEVVNCKCRFQWCCKVNCETCTVNRTINRCR